MRGEDKPGTAIVKGHEFVQISYHMPTTCEVCPKPLWHMFRPPPAVECRRCRIKVHKEHLDKKEDAIAPCKLHLDPTSAKDLLLLAHNSDDQKAWVQRLSRKIQKCGYKANNCVEGSKISPRFVCLSLSFSLSPSKFLIRNYNSENNFFLYLL